LRAGKVRVALKFQVGARFEKKVQRDLGGQCWRCSYCINT